MEPITLGIIILSLAATVLVVASVCRRFGFPAPLVLVVVGTVASFLPFVPTIELTSDLVLLGFLPPLLYAAAIRTSLIDIRANFRTILWLAVGLVVFTMFVVGLLSWVLLPIPLAVALAFGAVVSPPDAVAATAVARRIGLPRRIVTVLEGESLLNDATALVALSTAGLALSQTVSVGSVSLDFLLKAGGGTVIGVVVAAVIIFVRKRMRDTVTDTLLSFMAPFLAYIPAEEVHSSGVIAVVVAGLLLGHKAPIVQDAQSRMSERVNWNTIQFLLENAVFLLLGLQLRWILEAVGEDDLSAGTIVTFCVGALLAAIIARPIWIFAGRYVLWSRDSRGRTQFADVWPGLAVASWAGMRGVVTIAAAFLLPPETPHRPTLILGAFVVTAGTLLIQGLSLPWLARTLKVRGPDRREDMLAEASVMQAAVTAGAKALEQARQPGDSDEVVDELIRQSQVRTNRMWERLGRVDGEPPSTQHRRLRMAMLAGERAEVLRLRDEGSIDHEILATVMDAMDVEESILTVFSERAEADAAELAAPAAGTGGCEHLQEATDCVVPSGPTCQGCIDEHTEPVHLRMCLTCGHVGCCDSSVGLHADRHFRETGHPVMRSFEPGESWRWCYVDELTG